MSRDPKDIPVPSAESTSERPRARPEATIAITTRTDDARAITFSQAPLYSAKPPASDGHPTSSEHILPTATTVGTILEHIRKAPADRLEVEVRLASGGMGSIDVAIDPWPAGRSQRERES